MKFIIVVNSFVIPLDDNDAGQAPSRPAWGPLGNPPIKRIYWQRQMFKKEIKMKKNIGNALIKLIYCWANTWIKKSNYKLRNTPIKGFIDGQMLDSSWSSYHHIADHHHHKDHWIYNVPLLDFEEIRGFSESKCLNLSPTHGFKIANSFDRGVYTIHIDVPSIDWWAILQDQCKYCECFDFNMTGLCPLPLADICQNVSDQLHHPKVSFIHLHRHIGRHHHQHVHCQIRHNWSHAIGGCY